MSTPFDAVNHISNTRPFSYHDIHELQLPYEPFLVNRAMSLHEDTVLAAALMNERAWLSIDAQVTFYVHAIRPRKRFASWPKGLVDDDIDVIARYYGMSKKEAKASPHLHTPEQLKSMRALLDEGATPSRFRT